MADNQSQSRSNRWALIDAIRSLVGRSTSSRVSLIVAAPPVVVAIPVAVPVRVCRARDKDRNHRRRAFRLFVVVTGFVGIVVVITGSVPMPVRSRRDSDAHTVARRPPGSRRPYVASETFAFLVFGVLMALEFRLAAHQSRHRHDSVSPARQCFAQSASMNLPTVGKSPHTDLEVIPGDNGLDIKLLRIGHCGVSPERVLDRLNLGCGSVDTCLEPVWLSHQPIEAILRGLEFRQVLDDALGDVR